MTTVVEGLTENCAETRHYGDFYYLYRPNGIPTWCLNLVHCRCVRCLWRQRVGVPSELGVAVKYRFSIVEPANHRNTAFFVMRETRLRVRERNED